MCSNVRGYEAKALLVKTSQTSQSQNFVLQMYIFKRQNEVLAVLKWDIEHTKTYVPPLLYEPLLAAGSFSNRHFSWFQSVLCVLNILSSDF